jgi:hypothetical protein
VAAALNAELQERVDTLAAERLQLDDRAARALREHDSAAKLAAAALQLKFAHAQVLWLGSLEGSRFLSKLSAGLSCGVLLVLY